MMPKSTRDALPATAQVAVVGAGAAGLMAAISAAHEGASVVLLEARDRVGQSILATGNGRCNFTNTNIRHDAETRGYHNAEFAEAILKAYPCSWALARFAELGVVAAMDTPGGRVYPRTYTASTVLDALRFAAKDAGVATATGFDVVSAHRVLSAQMLARDVQAHCGFEIAAADGRKVFASSLVIATGGGESLLTTFGHTTVYLRPVLCALRTEYDRIQGLDGVRVRCAVGLMRGGEPVSATMQEGELLFRKYGVSGIVVFDVSRYVRRGDSLSIDYLPEMQRCDVARGLERRLARFPERIAGDALIGLLPRPVMEAVLDYAGLGKGVKARDVDSASVERIADALKDFRITVTGFANTKHAQVTRGGACVREFDPSTCESLLQEGLFAAGEVLDVDGPCGGYNLHWAWASGHVAGECAAQRAQGVLEAQGAQASQGPQESQASQGPQESQASQGKTDADD